MAKLFNANTWAPAVAISGENFHKNFSAWALVSGVVSFFATYDDAEAFKAVANVLVPDARVRIGRIRGSFMPLVVTKEAFRIIRNEQGV